MTITILYFALPLIISICLIPIITDLAKSNAWVDRPDDRKIHVQPIPALGGVAIFIGCASALFCAPLTYNAAGLQFLGIAALLIFSLGLLDDLRNLSAKKRLLVQFFTAALCFAGGSAFVSDYGILGGQVLPVALQFAASCFFIVMMINAFNLIDGINGLAGGLALLASLCFAYLFAQAGSGFWTAIALMVAGSALGFLTYNFNKATIFMGDNGSTFLGLALAVFFMQYINLPALQSAPSNHFLLAASLLALPIFDLIRVSIGRMAKGKSPFSADQSHIHHLLLKNLKTHKSTALYIIFFQFFLFGLTSLLIDQCSPIQLLFVLSIVYVGFIQMAKVGQALTEIKSMEEERRQVGILFE